MAKKITDQNERPTVFISAKEKFKNPALSRPSPTYLLYNKKKSSLPYRAIMTKNLPA